MFHEISGVCYIAFFKKKDMGILMGSREPPKAFC